MGVVVLLVGIGLLIRVPSTLRAIQGNVEARALLSQLEAHSDLLQRGWEGLLPIGSALLYIPRSVAVSQTTVTQDARVDAAEQPPEYRLHALTSDWSLEGYDYMDGSQTLLLRWQTARQYAVMPVTLANQAGSWREEDHYFQAVELKGQSSQVSFANTMRTLNPGCPSQQSVVANKWLWDSLSGASAGVLGNSRPVVSDATLFYTTPVMVDGVLCYFAVIWPRTGGSEAKHPPRVVAADQAGAWVLVSNGAPSLSSPYPGWDFVSSQSPQGWHPADSETTIRTAGDGLQVETASTVSRIQSPQLRIDARQAHHVRIRLRARAGNTIELFWTTLEQPHYGRQNRLAKPLAADGDWHEYEFDLSDVDAWNGVVTGLRVDPSNRSAPVDVASIRLER